MKTLSVFWAVLSSNTHGHSCCFLNTLLEVEPYFSVTMWKRHFADDTKTISDRQQTAEKRTLGNQQTLLNTLPLKFYVIWLLPTLQQNIIIIDQSGSKRWMSKTVLDIYIGLAWEQINQWRLKYMINLSLRYALDSFHVDVLAECIQPVLSTYLYLPIHAAYRKYLLYLLLTELRIFKSSSWNITDKPAHHENLREWGVKDVWAHPLCNVLVQSICVYVQLEQTCLKINPVRIMTVENWVISMICSTNVGVDNILCIYYTYIR